MGINEKSHSVHYNVKSPEEDGSFCWCCHVVHLTILRCILQIKEFASLMGNQETWRCYKSKEKCTFEQNLAFAQIKTKTFFIYSLIKYVRDASALVILTDGHVWIGWGITDFMKWLLSYRYVPGDMLQGLFNCCWYSVLTKIYSIRCVHDYPIQED